MKSPKFSGKPRKLPKSWLVIRRVAGSSMEPALRSGGLVVGFGRRSVKPGQVVIFRHHGYEKIKRVIAVEKSGLRLAGDNPTASTDSRDFGLVSTEAVLAVVQWPRLSLYAKTSLGKGAYANQHQPTA